jgi:prepilin-type N-terminal cleavage/methylation domain-containing protein
MTMPRRPRSHRRRHSRGAPTRRYLGFTLIELMIAVTLLGIIGTLLTGILTRQQRFHHAVMNVTDARARMRDIATILPTDLRGISTAGKDILSVSDTSIQFRAFVGTSIVCKWATADGTNPAILELPPTELASGNILASWINPPAPDDIAYLYDQGTKDGNIDDTWDHYRISDTTSGTSSTWCPSSTGFTAAADNSALRYRITLDGAPPQSRIIAGAVIRFAREVRYSIYQASDTYWYVGYQRCTPNATYGSLGTCGTREVLAGPVKAAAADTTSSGFYLVYRNKSGTRLTTVSSTDTIAAISIGIRTESESLLGSTSSKAASQLGGDSLRFTVGIRNRI